MMKRGVLGWATVAFVAASPCVMAQTVLDGSFPANAGISLEQLHKAVTARFNDPSSAQYKSFHQTDKMICGLVNSKNPHGGYDGFDPFVLIKADLTTMVVSPERLKGFRPSLTKMFDAVHCPLSSLGL
jgi:hypothetical protein